MSENMRASERWVFDSVGRDTQGWNLPGEDSFAGNPLAHLTREVIQNSLDARADENRPVRVEFIESRVSFRAIPGFSSLRAALEQCWKYPNAEDLENPESRAQIRQAMEMLDDDEETIPVLSISDSGTFGMEGPYKDETSRFYKYTTTEGVSGNDNRSGSHGIGKIAPLLVSVPRCIFVSTVWKDEKDAPQSLIQGRATFRSHCEARTGNKLGRKGYWGAVGGDPLPRGGDPIPREACPKKYKWLQRDAVGTTIHILGWRPKATDWVGHVCGHAAVNFFRALERGRLEVEVREKDKIPLTLNKDSVSKMLALPRVENAMREVDRKSSTRENTTRLRSAQMYYESLGEAGQGGVQSQEKVVRHLGRCQVRIKVFGEGVDAPGAFLLLRNDIWIKEMGDRSLKNEYAPFAGVVECLSEEGKRLIRRMEPVAHNDLQPHRLEGEKGTEAVKSLRACLKEVADELASQQRETADVWGFTREYFSCEGDVEGDDRDVDFDSGVVINLGPPSQSKGRSPVVEEEEGEAQPEEGGEDGTEGGASESDGDGGTEPGHGPGHGDGTGGTGTQGGEREERARSREVFLEDVRILQTGHRSVKAWFTPTRTADTLILLYEVAADGERRKISVLEPSENRERGGVWVPLNSGDRTSLDLTLRRDFTGGLALSALAKEVEKEKEADNAES